MPDFEDIYVNGLYFACDADMGVRPSQYDPGEDGDILEIYTQDEETNQWVALPQPWKKELVDILYMYIFNHEKYEKLHGKKACRG